MTGSELYELLGRQPSGEIRWGLRRTRELLAGVGSPHMAFRSIHVGGTNGKGSVAAIAASVLRAAGHRVGLYTSPHLVDFRERIVIDGSPVDRDLLAAGARRLRASCERTGATFFEATTALAFLCFAETNVEFGVAEVGLGGRLDATNVLLPEVAVITQVAWDHAEYLGHSLSAIAREKAGICKPGIPLVLGRVETEAGRVIQQIARRAGSPIRQIGRDAAVRRIRIGRDFTELEFRGSGEMRELRLRCPLLGGHQAWNVGVAVLALQNLSGPFRPQPAAIESGVRAVRWSGRLQVEVRGPTTWVLDVAHNPAAVDALAQALPSLDLAGPITLVLGILGDKPWAEMLTPLLAFVDRSIFTIPPCAPPERRWKPRLVADAVSGYAVEVEEDFPVALRKAADGSGTVIVTGSSYTVGDAMRHLELPVILPLSDHDG